MPVFLRPKAGRAPESGRGAVAGSWRGGKAPPRQAILGELLGVAVAPTHGWVVGLDDSGAVHGKRSVHKYNGYDSLQLGDWLSNRPPRHPVLAPLILIFFDCLPDGPQNEEIVARACHRTKRIDGG